MPAAWKLSHLGKTMESGKPESVKSVAPRAYVNTQKPNTKAASLLFATSVFLLSQTIVLSNFPSPFLASYPSNEYPFRTFLPRRVCTRLAPAIDPCARLLLTAFYNFRSPEPVTCCQTKHLPGAKASHRAFVLLYRHTRSLSCLLGFTIVPFDLIASFLWHLLCCCPSVTAISMTARTVGMAVIGGGAV